MSTSTARAKRRSPAKKEQLLVYLAPGQTEQVRAAAKAVGLTNSEFARRALAVAVQVAGEREDE